MDIPPAGNMGPYNDPIFTGQGTGPLHHHVMYRHLSGGPCAATFRAQWCTNVFQRPMDILWILNT